MAAKRCGTPSPVVSPPPRHGGYLFALALVAAVLALPQSAWAGLTGSELRVTGAAGDQWDPAVSGPLVVYTDLRGADTDVWYTDLATGAEYPVSVDPGYQQLTDVSDGKIVFTDYSTADVLVFDTATGVKVNLTEGVGSNSLDPAISRGLVAWKDDRDGNLEIYARDLATGEERRITASPDADEQPAVGGRIIVWQRCDANGVCDVFAYDWTTGVTRQLTATAWGDERRPDISGRVVVFQANRDGQNDVVAFDLDAGSERVLALPGDQVNPHVSEGNVAFDDLSGAPYHIGLWNLASGERFQVTTGTSGQYLNDIDGNRIVYTDDRNGGLDIYLYAFAIETSPPPPPPPVGVPADCERIGDAAPLLDQTFVRSTGKPHDVVVHFAAQAGLGLVCFDNGAPPVTSGWVELNQRLLVEPEDWASGLARRPALGSENVLSVKLAGKPGSSVRVRVFGPPAEPSSVPLGGALWAGTGGAAMGCSQSGGELVPWVLALLAVLALLPRPAQALARIRRRR